MTEALTIEVDGLLWMAKNFAEPHKNAKAPNGDESLVSEYGYLYDWNTAKELCPDGWRLPTISEFQSLIDKLTGEFIVRPEAFTILPAGSSYFGWYVYFGEYASFWTGTESSKNSAYNVWFHGSKSWLDDASKDRWRSVRYVKNLEKVRN